MSIKPEDRKGLIAICDGCPLLNMMSIRDDCGMGYDVKFGTFRKLGAWKNKGSRGNKHKNYYHHWSKNCRLNKICAYGFDGKGITPRDVTFRPIRREFE